MMQSLLSTQEPTCKKLQPSFILQHLLEGISNPMILFTNSYSNRAPTPFLKVATLNFLWTTFQNIFYQIHLSNNHHTTCRPPFIKFSNQTHINHKLKQTEALSLRYCRTINQIQSEVSNQLMQNPTRNNKYQIMYATVLNETSVYMCFPYIRLAHISQNAKY